MKLVRENSSNRKDHKIPVQIVAKHTGQFMFWVHGFESLDGVNFQPSNSLKFNRQPS